MNRSIRTRIERLEAVATPERRPVIVWDDGDGHLEECVAHAAADAPGAEIIVVRGQDA